MQVEALKTKPRQLTVDVTTYGIQSWGYCNDYPNRVLETIACSPTALLCAETYQRFQEGKGFKDKTFWGENDEILTNICIDRSKLGGCAVWIGIDGMLSPTEPKFVNFDFCRLTTDFKDPKYKDVFHRRNKSIAVYDDWGRRDLNRYGRIDPEKIQYYPRYKDDYFEDKGKLIALIQSYGGFENFPGFILWYSSAGKHCYPTPIVDAVIADAKSEESFATVRNRSVDSGFMPASILCTIGGDQYRNLLESEAACLSANLNFALTNPASYELLKAYRSGNATLADNLVKIQGAETANKIIQMTVSNKEEIPQILDWKIPDYDKLFNNAELRAQANIGKRFNQHPLLRNEYVGSALGSGAEFEMAFYVYNSWTNPDRRAIERFFIDAYKYYPNIAVINPTNDFTVDVLTLDVPAPTVNVNKNIKVDEPAS